MDLYGYAMAGSFAAHVACLEAGIPFTYRRVDRRTRLLDDGRDYRALVPLALAPALRLDDGSVLTETSAVLQLIADRAPERRLAPPFGTPARYALMQWLNFVSTEIHKKHVAPLFRADTPPEVRQWARASAPTTLAYVAQHLERRAFLLGDDYSVADAYLGWALFVLPHGGFAIDAWPALAQHLARVTERPSFQQALAVEGRMYREEQAAAR